MKCNEKRLENRLKSFFFVPYSSNICGNNFRIVVKFFPKLFFQRTSDKFYLEVTKNLSHES